MKNLFSKKFQNLFGKHTEQSIMRFRVSRIFIQINGKIKILSTFTIINQINQHLIL
jgi:hypothetical protein